jgi:hypothetical protein
MPHQEAPYQIPPYVWLEESAATAIYILIRSYRVLDAIGRVSTW